MIEGRTGTVDPISMTGGTHSLLNQLIIFSAPDNTLHYRSLLVPVPVSIPPDEHARSLLGWDTQPPAHALVHSTSWQSVPDHSGIVLTWAVLPDPDPFAVSLPVTRPVIAQGSDAAHPVPRDLGEMNVVVHAARHLAFLSHTDPAVRVAIHGHRNMHDVLLAFAPDVAGGAH